MFAHLFKCLLNPFFWVPICWAHIWAHICNPNYPVSPYLLSTENTQYSAQNLAKHRQFIQWQTRQTPSCKLLSYGGEMQPAHQDAENAPSKRDKSHEGKSGRSHETVKMGPWPHLDLRRTEVYTLQECVDTACAGCFSLHQVSAIHSC